MNNAESLYENHKHKTRILLVGDSHLADVLLHNLSFCNHSIDFQLSNGRTEDQDNDFFLLATNSVSDTAMFRPTVVFIANNEPFADYSSLMNHIVGGGILVYDEANQALEESLSSCENFFRKLPFTAPEIKNSQLQTALGDIPVSTDALWLPHTEGLRLLCQQVGIMEEEFYESLMAL